MEEDEEEEEVERELDEEEVQGTNKDDKIFHELYSDFFGSLDTQTQYGPVCSGNIPLMSL